MDHAFEGCARWRGSADGFVLPGARMQYPPHVEIEPVHLDVDLAVDLDERSVAGAVTTTVRARLAGSRTLVLDAVAFRDLAVADAGGRRLAWSYDGRSIDVVWDEPFVRGEERSVAVTYRVVEPRTGIVFSRPTEAEPDLPWFAATDHETERARYWLPCVDLPHVRPTIRFRLRAASRFRILAGGLLVAETDHEDGTQTVEWRLDVPCPSYIACWAIGEFVEWDDGEFGGRAVRAYAPRPFTSADLETTFRPTRGMLAWIERKLGAPHPFPKYYQFAALGIGGAMENVSLVSWDDTFLMDEPLAAEWRWRVDQTTLHEMAHGYFGDAIVCRDFAHAWLKESWATYLQQCWIEDEVGRASAEYQYLLHEDAYFEEADTKYRRPIVTREFHSSWQLYDRHLYPGGACRLHMLRGELGDEAFWDGVREYVRTASGRLVETDDFRRVLEERSGKSLGRFFDQWFHAPGYPVLAIDFDYDAAKREGTFKIRQNQEGVFEFPLELAWVVEGRTETRTIRVEKDREVVAVSIPKSPDQVRVDPGSKVIARIEFDPGEVRLRRQLREAPDVRGRVLAARELARTGTPENLEAIATAADAEAFWGVRAELARALAGASGATAVRLLAERVEREGDPRALEPVFRAAGRHRDPHLRRALEARLAGPLGPRARMAALESLGAQREDAPFETLLEASRTSGRGGFAQSGALRGLAATRRPEALQALLERLPPGSTDPRARPAAAAALADLGRTLERRDRERVVERLVDLLRDPSWRVQQAAAQGLATLGATEALPALEAFRGPLSRQDQVDVETAIHRIRRGDAPRSAALEKDLEALRAEFRNLEERLRKIENRGAGTDPHVP